MGKIFVLDTNVLLQDPRAIFAFEDNEVVIPAVVLEEIDSKKRFMDEIGRNARQVSRLLDNLRENGKLHTGVKLKQGGLLRVELNHRSFQKMQDTFPNITNDNRILAVAMNLQVEEGQKESGRPVILVSKDALVRVKADALGLRAEDYLSDRVIMDTDIYPGFYELLVDPDKIDEFYTKKFLDLKEIGLDMNQVYPNEFYILKDRFGTSKSAVAKVNQNQTLLEPLRMNEAVWGIIPRNIQQKMALELLLDDHISLITMTGRAGTGKTLLSLAAGLLKVEDEQVYHKLLVARPVIPMGRDLGFLPGEKEEKLRPWMQPIYDNLEYLFNTKKPGELDKILAGMGSIQVEALTYIRGRSIPNQFIIIDEAQNLTKHEVKTIITRVGEGSKIVLMGDPDQIDHPYLDAMNNGLTYVVERFKQERISGHIQLNKGERSILAQLAADLL
ncbi:PhoH family protein [Tepidibacillus fermentans]|uniref:PhoH-like ATPase n=1 Tax=Tepidibacillus fermentans TaxID=1281767 RepID=A0A4R3KN40_9BACI|nr:PhoH family protein [Tepidibacillus fermentans]TCS84438.1 PhoH-like ATPase [Tepidibacillus fermentans]